MFIRGSGRMDRHTVSESLSRQMALYMRDNGVLTACMAKDARAGPTEVCMRENLLMEYAKELEFLFQQMETATRAHSSRTRCTGTVRVCGAMRAATRASGAMEKCMAKVFTIGQMDVSMREHMKTTLNLGNLFFLNSNNNKFLFFKKKSRHSILARWAII
jgi:hypothetical protein